MEKRNPLSKKTRFEVFKRDSFTCQYCGSKSPDVILEVDHILPISKGGKNEILNLITACFDCNRGKRDNKISDNSVISKQRQQIEELNIRRQQLEMMLKWRDGISDIENITHKKAIEYFNKHFTGFKLSVIGEKSIIKCVKKFGLKETLDAIDISINKYMKSDNDLCLCLNKVGGILACSLMSEDERKISYIKGICRNKYSYVPEPRLSIELKKYNEDGYDLDDLKDKLINNKFSKIEYLFNFLKD